MSYNLNNTKNIVLISFWTLLLPQMSYLPEIMIPPELSQLQKSVELAVMGKFKLALLCWMKALQNINDLPPHKMKEEMIEKFKC
uniref:Uncharacterized protein n=1 Tax=Romanomermis culicivorax TaxID=13658 RepID=A0A915IFM9_ROMCU